MTKVMVRTLFFSLFVFSAVARAGHPAEEEIRGILNENFEAYNQEDVGRMLATLSPTLPGRNEFAQQAAQMFRDNDAYISVREFELLAVRGQYATARVVQGTLAAAGGAEATPEEVFYRANSKLLPDEEESQYVQAFKKERGKWRLWLIMTPPQAVTRSNNTAKGNDCPNGDCSFPRIRVTATR